MPIPVVRDFMDIDPRDIMNKTLTEVPMSELLMAYFRETLEPLKHLPKRRLLKLPSLR